MNLAGASSPGLNGIGRLSIHACKSCSISRILEWLTTYDWLFCVRCPFVLIGYMYFTVFASIPTNRVWALTAVAIDNSPVGIGEIFSLVMYSSSTSIGISWSISSSLSICGRPSSAPTYMSNFRIIQNMRFRSSVSIGSNTFDTERCRPIRMQDRKAMPMYE